MRQIIIFSISTFILLMPGVLFAQAPGSGAVSVNGSAGSMVVLNNVGSRLPLAPMATGKYSTVHMGGGSNLLFDSIINKYDAVGSYSYLPTSTDSLQQAFHDRMKLVNRFIVRISSASLTDKVIALIRSIEADRELTIVYYGAGDHLQTLEEFKCPIVWVADSMPASVSASAQLLFAGIGTTAKLQKNYSKKFRKGQGQSIIKTRLGYADPSAVGLTNKLADSIDLIVKTGIESHATPSAVVLLIKNGKVIMDKAYGSHTYEATEQTVVTDIFDLASVTKVTATTPAVMKLYDEQKLDLDSPISTYVNVLQSIPDKKDLRIKEALLHEAGFTPYIKFYEKLGPLDLSYRKTSSHPLPLAENFYLRKNYFEEVMWPVTLQSPVLTRGKYVYSDVSMYMMKQVVENVAHQTLDEYVSEHFYQPLGMRFTGFRPLLRFPPEQIVPTTENDNWLRNMQVRGYVNDPGAAMSGGVQGHAGLFSTTNDLAIYYQMLLNKGSYGGAKYIEPATVDLFTSKQSQTSGRGLGFIKKALNDTSAASASAFGHSGYTGTFVWVDPEYDMIYICLTNRVYPDDGKTFGPAKINIRARVLELFYKELLAAEPANTRK